MDAHEELFIREFIVDGKRERFLALLEKEKRRGKLLRELPHLAGWLRGERIVRVPHDSETADGVYRMLAELQAPEMCHLISDDHKLDGRQLSLRQALAETVGFRAGTVVSCIPGRLAYFEGEGAGERFVCTAPDRPTAPQ